MKKIEMQNNLIDKIEKSISEISGGVDFIEIQREIKDILDELVDSDEFELSYDIDAESIGRIYTGFNLYGMSMYKIPISSLYPLVDIYSYNLEQFYKSLLASGEFRFILTNIKLIIHDTKYKRYRRDCDSESKHCWGDNPPEGNFEDYLFKTLNHIKSVVGCEWFATFTDGELILKFKFDYRKKIKKFEHFSESLNHIPLEEYVEEISDIFQEYVDEWGLRKVNIEELSDFPDENVYNITRKSGSPPWPPSKEYIIITICFTRGYRFPWNNVASFTNKKFREDMNDFINRISELNNFKCVIEDSYHFNIIIMNR
jgi:hypothetical protein